MALHSTSAISLKEKPTKHISTQDWRQNVYDLQLFADGQRNNTIVLRNETKQARNEALIKSKWSRHNTNVLLEDRIQEEQEWLSILEKSREVLGNETDLLSEEKISGEREIESYFHALSVLSRCFHIRDTRSCKDLTYDDTYEELQSELKLLEKSKNELTEKCSKAWDLLNDAKVLSTQISNNVKSKQTAVNIDTTALELDKNSAFVSNKPDVLRTPQGMIAQESWLQAAQGLQTEADILTVQLAKHRDAMKIMRERVKMEFLSQVEATNYALRKRIYNTNRLKNELEWQRKNTMEEMGKLKKEIDHLSECLAEHDHLLKCAETRHENRHMRPGMELARDLPHDGLMEEILHLRQTLRSLRDKIDASLCLYNKLETVVAQLDAEIASKELCIQVEMRTLDARINLVEHQPCATMDQNSVLVKMEKQIAPPPCT